MDKAYDHNSTEDKLYNAWEQSGKMRADEKSAKKPFTIPLPPPNVTGQLHLGHAAMLAIEDILIRYKKMTDHEVCWLPGTDHAAIATENVVIKNLGAKSREDYSREEFLDHCRKFSGEKHDRIVTQMKKMGAWLDWSRESYTLDEPRSNAVTAIFKKLYDDELIERGHRMINWSVGAQSVLSDDEVEWEEAHDTFYHIKCGPFIIGTVRPETKCADSPVMVHPDGPYVILEDKKTKEELIVSKALWEKSAEKDSTYDLQSTHTLKEELPGHELVGRKFTAETYAGKRHFWVVADEYIDPDFGTGTMTISPAHDANDFMLAEKHDFDLIQKISFDGKMTDIAGPCAGLPVEKARKKSAEIMEQTGLLFKSEAYTHQVPKCYRSNCIVEPMLSPQWFILVDKEYDHPVDGKTTLKKQMQAAVRENHVKIIPERFNKTYFQWIDNLRDWCISRQIWWGHRIPVWYDDKGGIAAVGEDPKDSKLRQDEDTLDTWFSSALWPISPLGWPEENNPDFQKFYPSDVLETGHDILFFWVARMIMFGRYATGEYPFHTVYLHGLVCDEHGKKMSKSKGNGIDPIEVIDEVGADAVRLSLVIGSSPGNNIPIGKNKIKGYRNFVNKLWNAGRFVKMQTENGVTEDLTPKNLAEKWILSRFSTVASEISNHLEKFEISAAGDKIYHFVWDEFCAWFLEAQKVESNPGFLAAIFREVLKLTHPLCPFITESVWQELYSDELVIDQAYPNLDAKDMEAEKYFQLVQSIVTDIRRVRTENKLNPKEKISGFFSGTLHQEKHALIKELAGLSELTTTKDKPDNSVEIIGNGYHLFIEIPFDEAADADRKNKEKTELEKKIAMLEGRLSNKKYVQNAPAKLVDETKAQLEEAKELLTKIG